MDIRKIKDMYRKTSDIVMHHRMYRSAAYATSIFLISMIAIYSTSSDRVKIEEQSLTRIQASSQKTIEGGISINGIKVNYDQHDPLTLKIEDFLNSSDNSYNIRFDKDHASKVQNAYLTFSNHGKKYVKEVSFDNFSLQETRELTVAGSAQLENIRIEENDKTYTIDFYKQKQIP